MRSFTPLWGASFAQKDNFCAKLRKNPHDTPFSRFFCPRRLAKKRRKEEKGKEGEKKAVWDEVSNPHKNIPPAP